ncbi:hypothetical protein LZ198_35495 [Myxococcus sp. K15C18031901]|uniref:hypothetical protein n=1 Tax=Myxococcus dinghuensis TaxID=2906761 RepID=UPI0020A6F74A|nr:hypothetical protein [Myxococcus dinghuensis]MCP3104182.1 hypothetical protein [Myxococcus dinghuensis]
MNAKRFAVSLVAMSSLFLTACGGGADAEPVPPEADAMVGVEQGIGIPPNCPNNDLVYWFENIRACVVKCGASRIQATPATQYAGCQSNLSNTRTLINANYCIPGCDLQ